MNLQSADLTQQRRLILSCFECRRLFVQKNIHNQKYCSNPCSIRGYSRARRTRIPPHSARICWECGKSIMHLASNVRYCGVECRREAKRKQKKQQNRVFLKIRREGRKCYRCGKSIEHLMANFRYCGAECRREARNKRHNEWKRTRNEGRAYGKGKTRARLLQLVIRQEGKCYICRRKLPENASLIHVDHVFPQIAGGKSDPSNLRAACSSCNQSKKGNIPTITQPGLDLPLPIKTGEDE